MVAQNHYKEFKLDNGLYVAMKKIPSSSVSARLRVNQGSYHEKENERGLAHFLEHCILESENKEHSRNKIAEMKDFIPYINAGTTWGRTFFEGEFFKEDFPIWTEYISNSVFNSTLNKEVIEKERGRVLSEILNYKNPYKRELNKLKYGNHPLAFPVLGDKERVRKATRGELQDIYSRGFYPNNSELVVTGNIPNNLEKTIEESFSKFESGNDTKTNFPNLNSFNRKNIVRRGIPESYNSKNPSESNVLLYICFSAPADTNKERFQFETINKILGKNLFQKVSDEKGLVYSIVTDYSPYYNTGISTIDTKTPYKNLDKTLKTIFRTMKDIKEGGDSVQSIENEKRKGILELKRNLESNWEQIGEIERKIDNTIPLQRGIEEYEKITPEKIKETANKYFPDKDGNYLMYILDPMKKE